MEKRRAYWWVADTLEVRRVDGWMLGSVVGILMGT